MTRLSGRERQIAGSECPCGIEFRRLRARFIRRRPRVARGYGGANRVVRSQGFTARSLSAQGFGFAVDCYPRHYQPSPDTLMEAIEQGVGDGLLPDRQAASRALVVSDQAHGGRAIADTVPSRRLARTIAGRRDPIGSNVLLPDPVQRHGLSEAIEVARLQAGFARESRVDRIHEYPRSLGEQSALRADQMDFGGGEWMSG